VQILFWSLLGFFLGAIPFSLLIGKAALRTDIRTVGDGNPGATNVLRSGSKAWAAMAMLLDMLKGALPGWLLWPLSMMALGVGVRALTAAFSRQRVRDALGLPISVILMAVIASQAIYWRVRYGGVRWKGRTLPT